MRFPGLRGSRDQKIRCRFQACSLRTIEVARKARLLELPPESSRIFGIPGASVSRPSQRFTRFRALQKKPRIRGATDRPVPGPEETQQQTDKVMSRPLRSRFEC